MPNATVRFVLNSSALSDPVSLLRRSSLMLTELVKKQKQASDYSVISSHLSLNRGGRWSTTDDFATSFLHFSCSPLPSGTLQTPGLSIPWCCLPTSSSVCLVFFLLLLCLSRRVGPDLTKRRHVRTISVCVS